jgi:hypothetical protein
MLKDEEERKLIFRSSQSSQGSRYEPKLGRTETKNFKEFLE